MRTIAGPALALLGGRWALVQLIEMVLDSGTIRVATCRDDIDWLGNTFLGGRAIGADSIKDQGGEVQGLTFSLSGVPTEFLSIALQEAVQGKSVKIWTAILDPDSLVILDSVQTWAGTCDRMPIQQSGKSATINVTAEHRGIALARPKGLRYTDGDQEALFPGDKCLEFIVAQATHQDTWPAASFFRK